MFADRLEGAKPAAAHVCVFWFMPHTYALPGSLCFAMLLLYRSNAMTISFKTTLCVALCAFENASRSRHKGNAFKAEVLSITMCI